MSWNLHFQRFPDMTVHKAGMCFWVSISIRHIGLDVVDGSSVHEISSTHQYDRSFLLVHLHLFYPDARQSQVIRTEGRARCKYSHPLVAPQTWRSDGQRMSIFRGHPAVGRKFPDHPQIVETFQSADRLLSSVRCFKNDASRQ